MAEQVVKVVQKITAVLFYFFILLREQENKRFKGKS